MVPVAEDLLVTWPVSTGDRDKLRHIEQWECSMRTFIGLIILLAFAWPLDVFFQDGRNSRAIWQDAQLPAQKFRNEVRDRLNKTNFTAMWR